ncbi:hypothetical protein DFJ74DRAFT_488075 [Hyaloraphidium curvatum]|nr:hypothetical protein DFJ74DRAFT_488075 [Hyaloraphidium curvatum]
MGNRGAVAGVEGRRQGRCQGHQRCESRERCTSPHLRGWTRGLCPFLRVAEGVIPQIRFGRVFDSFDRDLAVHVGESVKYDAKHLQFEAVRTFFLGMASFADCVGLMSAPERRRGRTSSRLLNPRFIQSRDRALASPTSTTPSPAMVRIQCLPPSTHASASWNLSRRALPMYRPLDVTTTSSGPWTSRIPVHPGVPPTESTRSSLSPSADADSTW